MDLLWEVDSNLEVDLEDIRDMVHLLSTVGIVLERRGNGIGGSGLCLSAFDTERRDSGTPYEHDATNDGSDREQRAVSFLADDEPFLRRCSL